MTLVFVIAAAADPGAAYAQGAYDKALQGYIDLQVERPDDPHLTFNVGAAQYQMKDYEAAAKAFSEVAATGPRDLRGQARYNLGNIAYRQGKLDEAIVHYQAALEADPEDQDAKFNLEFIRDEIRRRHEEAQKRQQQQEQQQQPKPDEGGQSAQDPPPEEPTPGDADADRDGRSDGEEDKNKNDREDPGETDPSATEPPQGGDGAAAGEPTEGSAEGSPLSAAEARRYLQNIDDKRPARPHAGGARRRPDKDW